MAAAEPEGGGDILNKSPKNNKQYTQTRDGFQEIKGESVPLTYNKKPFDAVIYRPSKDLKSPYKYEVIEQYTGRRIGYGKTKTEAIETARFNLKGTKDINKKLNESNLSPRYK